MVSEDIKIPIKVKTGILEKKLNELKLNEMTPAELENIEVVLIQKRPYKKEVTEGIFHLDLKEISEERHS